MGSSLVKGTNVETQAAVRDQLDVMLQLQEIAKGRQEQPMQSKSVAATKRELTELKRFLRERNYAGVDPSTIPVHHSSGSLVAKIDPGNMGTVAARTVSFDTMIPKLPGAEKNTPGRLWTSSSDVPNMAIQDQIEK